MNYLSTFKISFLRNLIRTCAMTLLLFFSGTQIVQASHAMGADLTYSCISDDTYEITLTFYRDCSGTTAPTSPSVNISSATCGVTGATLSLVQQGPPVEISPICESDIANSSCNGGSLQGVEQYTYTGTFTFPQDCKDWIISYSLCCRNGAITNSVNPENYDIYVEALLNNLNVDCNNSPVFTTPPVPYICVGQPFNYNHGVLDAEGDSLVYTLVDPLNAPLDPVPYQAGFTSAYPISTVSGVVTFDTDTGQMGLTPDGVQIGIVAVLVREYRDGQLIGSTIRDMQVVVLNCNNNAPQVGTPVNVSGGQFDGTTFQVCAGNTLSFDIDASDADATDILSAIDNISANIPNASLTTTGTNPLTATFTWATAPEDVGNYGFAITIEDDACPIVGFQVLGYEIFVPGVNVEAADTTICPGVLQSIQLDAIPFGSLTPGTFTWSPATGLDDPNIQNPTATVDQTTSYTVTYDDGICVVSDEVEIVADGTLVVVSDCSSVGGGVQLEATYTATVPPAPPGCGISTGPCTAPYNTLDVGTDVTSTGPGGTNNEGGSPFLGYYEDGRTQVLYLAADLQAAGLVAGLISEAALNVSEINSSQPYSGFTIKMGCTEMTTMANTFVPGLDQVYTNIAVTPALGWNTYVLDDQYEWDGVSNLIVEFCYDNGSWTNYDHVYYSATTYNSVLFRRVDGNTGCNLTAPVSSFNRPNIRFTNCEVAPPPPTVTYDWLPAGGVNDPTIANPIADPSVSTIYTVTVTTTECSFTESIDISNLGFALSAMGEDLGCGGTIGSINVDVTGGTAPYTYDWSDDSVDGQEDPTGLLPGTYTLTVTDASGCSGVISADITSSTSLSLTAASTDVTCFGGNDGTGSITVTTGTAPYTYDWGGVLPATDTQTGLSAGTYVVTVTDVNGCDNTASITLIEPTELTVTTTGETLLCAGDMDGDISIVAAGGTAPYTYQWDNSLPATDTQTGLSAGTYTVIVTDANNCQVTATEVVDEPADALSVTSSSQDLLCFGDANGSIDLSVGGGTGTYTFTWDNGLPATEDQAGLSGGTYNYVVADVNGCSLNGVIIITEPATAVTAVATGETLACSGDTDGDISLTVSGGTGAYTYTWDNGAGTVEDPGGLSTGTYTVIVEDANGCTATTSAVIDVVNPMVLTTLNGIVNCDGDTDGSVTVTATGGTPPYSYVWDNGAPPVSNPSGLGAGNYNVTVYDANNCSLTDAASITAPNAMAISLSNTPVSCFGGNDGIATITPTGGTPPYTYLWGNGQTLPTATSLTGGPLSIIVTDDAGCTIQASVTITEPAELLATIDASTMTSCFDSNDGGATVVPSGGTPPYNYAWDNGESIATATSLSQGLHIVNITDGNGCTTQTNVTIAAPAQMQLSTTGTDLTCFQEGDGTATIAVISGGVAPYTYDWATGGTTNNVSGLAAGTYVVDVIDSNGCIEQASVTIAEPAEVTLLTTLNADASCFNTTDGQATVSASGGVGGYSFSWDNGELGTTAVGLSPGIHTVTGLDANGCSATATIQINAPTAIATSLTSSPASCFGGSDGTATVTVTGGTAPFTYLWEDGQVVEAATGFSAGVHTVTITDANGCAAEETIQVDQPASALETSLTASAPSCNGYDDGAVQSQTSGGTPPYTYTWSTGGTGNSVSNLIDDTYTLTITDANNCQIIESVEVQEPNAIQLSAVSTDVNCFGGDDGTIYVNALGGTGPYLYSLDGEDYIFSPEQIRLTAGQYTVYVQDDNGCVQTVSSIVNEPPELIVDIIDNIRINYGDSIMLETSVNQIDVDYIWSPTENLNCGGGDENYNCPNPVATPPFQTTYSVTVIDSTGCEAEADVIVYINKERPVFIPSGFTPNGDQANDVFMVHGGAGVETLKAFRVFDRWGEAVFEVRDAAVNTPEAGWDGTFRGQEMNPGVFTYYVEVVFSDGEIIPYQGDVTLIR